MVTTLDVSMVTTLDVSMVTNLDVTMVTTLDVTMVTTLDVSMVTTLKYHAQFFFCLLISAIFYYQVAKNIVQYTNSKFSFKTNKAEPLFPISKDLYK